MQTFSSERTANIPAYISGVGFTTIVVVGITGCVALILSFMWLLVHVALFLLQSTIEALSTIGTTYAAADPRIRLFILICLVFGAYRVYCKRKVQKP